MPQRIVQLGLFLSISLWSLVARAASGLNMPYGVTPMSHEIYKLHMAAFYVCCGIGVIVFSVLIYSLIKFRKSKGAKAAHFHEHLGLEIFWTAIPTFILIALAIPATIALQHIHNTDQSDITIKVTGYQWKWKYDYLDQGVSFFSVLTTNQDQINNVTAKNPWFLLEVDNPVVVPVNTKVKLLITADDVIHAWWVPELGIKQDAVPGFINENWFYATKTGIYRGQCGELCGVNHGFMPIVVQVVTKAEFDTWVKTKRQSAEMLTQKQALNAVPLNELLKTGKAAYEKNCGMCHQNSGEGQPPTFPALKKSKVVAGPLTADIAYVMKGVPGTAMQPFGDQLDNKTLAAIITYTRNAWGNDVINRKKKNALVVQPQDIEDARHK